MASLAFALPTFLAAALQDTHGGTPVVALPAGDAGAKERPGNNRDAALCGSIPQRETYKHACRERGKVPSHGVIASQTKQPAAAPAAPSPA
jgi:hypothetical protein